MRLRLSALFVCLLAALGFVAPSNFAEASDNQIQETLSSPTYALWNGFLGMSNVLELVNTGENSVSVTYTLYDIQGKAQTTQSVNLNSREQRDVILNSLVGFAADSYGIIKITFSGGELGGRVSFYRNSADPGWTDNRYEFAFSVPFGNTMVGTSAVGYNTFQPSRNPADADFEVANWLSIVNLDPSKEKRFTVTRYNQAGEVEKSETHPVPAFGRIDLDGGHGAGANHVGYNEIKPLDENSPYLAQLVRYGANSPAGTQHTSYAFAFPLSAKIPQGGTLWAPISRGSQAQNWVEVVNTSEETETVAVTLFDNQGNQVLSKEDGTFQLTSHAQAHINASALLPEGMSGAARIETSNNAKVIGQSMSYFFDNNSQSITSMYGSQLSPASSSAKVGSWNLYLNMQNWLRLFNTSSVGKTVVLTVHYYGTYQQRSIYLGAKNGIDLAIDSTNGAYPDAYGLFSISGSDIIGEMIKLRLQTDTNVDFIAPTKLIDATVSDGGGSSSSAIRFSFTGAHGLALGASTSQTTFKYADKRNRALANNTIRSNLRAVHSVGKLQDAMVSGSADIEKFLISPTGKVYIVFRTKTDLETSQPDYANGCLLAEIDPLSGIPTCVDSTLSYIYWSDNFNSYHQTSPIQFDGEGAIYYFGSNGQGTVLRKYHNGQSTDIINDNMGVHNFLVLPSGETVISGYTYNTNAQWIRTLSSQGSLKNIKTSTTANFLALFPDNNVYFGIYGSNDYGVRRYLPESKSVDSDYWLTNSYWGTAYYFTDDICEGQWDRFPGFCDLYGSYVKSFHRTTDGKMFAVAGSGWNADGSFMEYYPSVRHPETVVKKVSVAQGVLRNMILAGVNESDRNIMTLFDTSDDSEIDLLGDLEVEVYRLNYVSGDNLVMFDGLRFSDNKYVLGQVDLGTLEVRTAATGSTKLVDFQTFSFN